MPDLVDDIRVLLVDDEWLVRSGLRTMLSGQDGISIVGEAGDGTDVAALVLSTGATLVLMDIRMPRVNGVEATKALRALPDPPQVIVLTTFDHDDLVLRALRAGASAFLVKDTPPPDLAAAIRKVAAGEQVLSPAVLRRLILRVTQPSPPTARTRHLAKLTPAERRIAIEVAQGRSNAQIGGDLHLSIATVKSHVSRIIAKLGVANRVQVALLLRDEASTREERGSHARATKG